QLGIDESPATTRGDAGVVRTVRTDAVHDAEVVPVVDRHNGEQRTGGQVERALAYDANFWRRVEDLLVERRRQHGQSATQGEVVAQPDGEVLEEHVRVRVVALALAEHA